MQNLGHVSEDPWRNVLRHGLKRDTPFCPTMSRRQGRVVGAVANPPHYWAFLTLEDTQTVLQPQCPQIFDIGDNDEAPQGRRCLSRLRSGAIPHCDPPVCRVDRLLTAKFALVAASSAPLNT